MKVCLFRQPHVDATPQQRKSQRKRQTEEKGTSPHLFGTAFALTHFDLRQGHRSRMLDACRS